MGKFSEKVVPTQSKDPPLNVFHILPFPHMEKFSKK